VTVVRCTLLSVALVALAGCASGVGLGREQGLTEKAEAEATAIVQRAEATAIVLRALATAAALTQSVSESKRTPMPATPEQSRPTIPAASKEAVAPVLSPTALPAVQTVALTPTVAAGSKVELLGVGFAADGGFIIARFKAPPSVTREWTQSNVYVVDEATGTVYNEVPVMPTIGPLFERPRQEGKPGYVMLVNTDGSLTTGALVTVVLGDFRQEHVRVQ